MRENILIKFIYLFFYYSRYHLLLLLLLLFLLLQDPIPNNIQRGERIVAISRAIIVRLDACFFSRTIEPAERV